MDTIHIFLASDNNYAQHAGVVIASIIYNHKGGKPIVIHYLDGGLSPENKTKIAQVVASATGVKLVFHNMINEFKSIPVSRHITHAAYYRLMIDKLLPATVKKAIYLDTDLVVLKDIECLWNIDIKNYALGAVEDTGLRHEINTLKEKLLIPKERKYFNSGVLLLNLCHWRENNIGNKIMDFLLNPPLILPYHDQDAMNAVLWQDTLFIDPKWNVHKELFHHYYMLNRFRRLTKEFIDAARDPAIVHFTGSIKPWHYACGIPYAEQYYFYIGMTPWSGYKPNDKSLKGLRKKWGWKIKKWVFR